MNEILNTLPFTSLLAFALTYLLHSTVWIMVIAFLVKAPFFQSISLKNHLWKAALVGAVATSIFAAFYGTEFFKIPITEHVVQELSIADNVLDKSPFVPANKEEISSPIIDSQKNTAILSNTNPGAKKPFDATKLLSFGLIFWLLGGLFLLLKMFGEHWIFFRKISPRVVVKDAKTIHIFKSIQRKSNLRQSIKLTQSSTLDSPILIRNREICLPEKAVSNMEKEQMEGMLAHELAHIARKDYYWTCGLAILNVLFFFQPLQHWAKKEIDNSNELLCDAWAAQITGNNLALAKCLLTVATWIKKPTPNYALVAGMSLRKSELSNRVQSLIQFSNGKNSRFSLIKLSMLFTALLAIFVFVLPAFSFSSLIELKPTVAKILVVENPVSEVKNLQEPEKPKVQNPIPKSTETEKVKTPKKCFKSKKQEFEGLSEKKKQCAYLIAAVETNDLKKVKKLLVTTSPNCLYCGSTSASSPINVAARSGNIKMTQLLLESGSSLYTKSHKDEGALIAAARNNNITLMQLFYDYGACLDCEIESYGTTLTNAIDYNQYEMVQFLLARISNPMKPLKNGKTSLDYARAKGGKMWELVSQFNESTVLVNTQNQK